MQTETLGILTAAWPSRRYPATGCFIRNLTTAFTELGQRVAVVVPSPGTHDGGLTAVRGFPNPLGRPKLNHPTPLLGLLYLISAIRSSLEVFRRARPRALLVHWVLPTGPAGLVAARTLNVPLIVWAHGSDLEVYAARSGVFGRLAGWVVRNAAQVFAVSKSLADKAHRLGCSGVIRLPMGVASPFKELPPLAHRADPFTVLFVGDLIPSKGVRVVLNTRRLLGPKRRLRYVFVGTGPLVRELERSGSDVVCGADAGQVAALMDTSHVLVLPSRSEGAPVSVLEALCRGVPVIATSVGGIPEWIRPGREGLLLAPPATPHALARSIARVYDDRDLWQRLHEGSVRRGKAVLDAREVAARFLAELAAVLKPHVNR